jgi:hypothetical protein
LIERNQPCPCGSGKKYKKCCGAAGAATQDGTPGARSPGATTTTSAAKPSAPAVAATESSLGAASPATPANDAEAQFMVSTGRGLDSDRTEAERKKHLRKRIQDKELRGTLVYNSGAFFKPPPR